MTKIWSKIRKILSKIGEKKQRNFLYYSQNLEKRLKAAVCTGQASFDTGLNSL